MSVKIRLSQRGKKNARTYRVVVMDESKKRDGAYLELLGSVTLKHKNEYVATIKAERVAHWVGKGAQITPAVQKYLSTS